MVTFQVEKLVVVNATYILALLTVYPDVFM